MWPRESTPETVPTYEIARPDYDRPGVLLDDFRLYPSVTENAKYDDNIFASNRRVAADFVNTTAEELAFTSDWSRDRVSGRLFTAQQVYAAHPGEDADTYGAEASGRLDVTRDSFFRLDGGFVQQPQLRASPEASTNKTGRPIFNNGTAALNFFQRFNHLAERVQASFARVDYVTSGNESRNATTQDYKDRVSYDLSEELSVFVQAGYSVRDWDKRPSERNFDTLTGLVGVTAEIPTVLEGEIGVGVLRQGYANDEFSTLVTPVASGHLLWNVLPLTSILASIDRTVTGTETFCGAQKGSCQPAGSAQPIPPGGGVRNTLETTMAQVGVQHELWHDLLGATNFRYERNAFGFNDATFDTYSVSANARYMINRNLEADLDYSFQMRDASRPNDTTFNSGAFSENIIVVSIKAGL